jgi:hypothetical protein
VILDICRDLHDALRLALAHPIAWFTMQSMSASLTAHRPAPIPPVRLSTRFSGDCTGAYDGVAGEPPQSNHGGAVRLERDHCGRNYTSDATAVAPLTQRNCEFGPVAVRAPIGRVRCWRYLGRGDFPGAAAARRRQLGNFEGRRGWEQDGRRDRRPSSCGWEPQHMVSAPIPTRCSLSTPSGPST